MTSNEDTIDNSIFNLLQYSQEIQYITDEKEEKKKKAQFGRKKFT